VFKFSNSGGSLIYTSSEIRPFKNEILTSIWYKIISWFTTYDSNNLIASNLATWAKVLVKSIPYCWL